MVKYLSFHNSSFAFYDPFKSKWQGHNVTHPLFFNQQKIKQEFAPNCCFLFCSFVDFILFLNFKQLHP
jgi:hypothetical protein